MSNKGETMDNKEIAMDVAKILSGKKAADVMVIDVAEKSSFADYFVLATGGSDRQVGSLANDVLDRMAELGQIGKNVEGKPNSGWMLMDFGDVIVNIFNQEQRDRYNIEKIWGDCCFIEIED